MKNIIPTKPGALIPFAYEIAAGTGQYGSAIPLVLATEPIIVDRVTPLLEAISAVGKGKNDLKTKYAALDAKKEEVYRFLILARDNFKPLAGNTHNDVWNNIGLRGSLAISRREEKLVELLGLFEEWMANNANYEVVPKNVTAAHAETLSKQLRAARTAVNVQKTQVGNLIADRDARADDVGKIVRAVIAELDLKLHSMDDRWWSFGLNKPGAVALPEVPTNVTVVLIGPGAISVKWDPAARARTYRIWKKVVGVDEDFVLVDSRTDLDLTIEGLAPNSQVQIAVSAANDGGESAKSDVATVTTP